MSNVICIGCKGTFEDHTVGVDFAHCPDESVMVVARRNEDGTLVVCQTMSLKVVEQEGYTSQSPAPPIPDGHRGRGR